MIPVLRACVLMCLDHKGCRKHFHVTMFAQHDDTGVREGLFGDGSSLGTTEVVVRLVVVAI